MAAYLIRGLSMGAAKSQLFVRVSLLCLLSSVVYPLAANELPDPTQPPPGIYDVSTGSGTALAAKATAPTNNGLQSIIISPQRRAAVINGETVELGAKVGSAKLVEVSESGVILQGARGKRVLALFPGVNLRMRTTVPSQPVQKNTKSANEAVEHAVPKEKK